ncbi:MAG: DNA glycosylase AlkZ-like family protein [Nocardioides sp.]|uniref:DNA glycosylase AlkZ-like family protein n=1 Tax=Nocardioides sp. TaxID=35761 RepID=UPI003F0D9A84
MTPVATVSREHARRMAVRAQLLDVAPGTTPAPDAVDVVERLGGVQVDLTEAVARSADLVLRARLGASHPERGCDDLQAAGLLFEHRGRLVGPQQLARLRADMDVWPGRTRLRPWQDDVDQWISANVGARRAVIGALRSDGPLAARDLPDEIVAPWRSSGWSNNKSVLKLVECLESRGEVAVVSREGRERIWDLAERVHPDLPVVDHETAHREEAGVRLRAAGLLRPVRVGADVEEHDLSDIGVPVRVDGVRGTWRADEDLLEETADDPGTGVRLLSPLDRLVFDRRRASELFGFDYQLEMYKPAASRRWGYWALPVLHGSHLVGKVDVTADREAGVLHVDAVHRDGLWDEELADAVEVELDALARWLGLARP